MGMFITSFLGKSGLIFVVGILAMFIVYRYSQDLFIWIEDQTYGTRDYLLKRFELMHIDINPDKITYLLLGLSFGLGIVVFTILALLGHWYAGLFVGALLSFIGWKIPKPFVDHLYQKRLNLYQGQMVDALNLLSNGLRAGLSVPQAIAMVVEEMRPPISEEFATILQQNNLGVPLEEAFENLNKRVPTQDNEMFVTSVNILRETGGNLAETFDTIVDVIRERIKVQNKIEAITSQGKTQAMSLAAMPFLVLAMNYSMDPDGVAKMFTHWMGWSMLAIAIVIDIFGIWVVMKIITIKV